MRKRSRSSKSRRSQGSRKATNTLAPEELAPAIPKRANTTGLAIFPAELLHEIISYYPESHPEPYDQPSNRKKDPDARSAYRETLIALSRTCRNLRRFFLPHVWARIEVFTGMRVSTGDVLTSEEQLAVELIRQLEIVTIRDPGLARCVNVVDVTIKNYCVRNVVRELARCLAMFPNVHTLKLDQTLTTIGLDQAITYGFGRFKSLPQIRSITLPANCTALLKYVPGARYVFFRQPFLAGYWLLNLSIYCPLLENLRLAVPSSYSLLMPKFSNIRDLTLKFIREGEEFEIQNELNFIFLHFDRLKIVRMQQAALVELATWERYISQAKKALLSRQKNDEEEKIIVIDDRIITLPWRSP